MVIQLAWELVIAQGHAYPRRDHRFDVDKLCSQLRMGKANAMAVVRQAIDGVNL